MARLLSFAVPIALVGSFLLLGNEPFVPRPDKTQVANSQIDSTITHLMEAAHVTGAGIAIFHGGRIAYLKAYGSRDVEKRLPLTPNSVMTAASLSK